MALPPLGEVSRLDNTDSVPCPAIAFSHSPDLSEGVSSDVILQDDVTVNPALSYVPATCNIDMIKYFNGFDFITSTAKQVLGNCKKVVVASLRGILLLTFIFQFFLINFIF